MRAHAVILALLACAAASASCTTRPAMTMHPAGASCRSDGRGAAMQWIGPASARDRRRLDAWCAGVGPVFRQDLTGPADALIADGLTVVSWNTHSGLANVRRLVGELRAGALTDGRPVRHFVLLLQEVRRALDAAPSELSVVGRPTEEQQDIQRLSIDLGMAVVYAPAMRDGDNGRDRGNAILSTLPLAGVVIVELPFERQRRLAVIATASGTTPWGERVGLRVASVHFDTGLMMSRGGSDAARAKQAQALVDVLSSLPGPIVVGGDFNTEWNRGEPAVTILTRVLPDARQPVVDTWRGPLGLRRQLDYVFARLAGGETLNVARVSDRMGSDHHPLLAVVPTAVLMDEASSSAAPRVHGLQ